MYVSICPGNEIRLDIFNSEVKSNVGEKLFCRERSRRRTKQRRDEKLPEDTENESSRHHELPKPNHTIYFQ